MAQKLSQARLALAYAREVGDTRLTARMAARVNRIVANIAWGA